ncbi:MAG TPA: polysaccharide biosynthesis C-terminal domain-containing protein [Pyrinomonadaceae bacterium]|nr:polysaccharide biosynthesis C-terminal domain-containing protein [Pyrinomonadaceae bacterium]
MPSFTARIAWTFGTRVLMIVNSVVAGIIVAHWLGAEGVGQLAVINVTIATVVQVGSFGLPSSNTYFIAQDQARFRAAAINSLIFAAGTGVILALALSAIASSRPDWFGLKSPDLIHIAAVSIPSQLLTLIGLNTFLAVGKVRQFNLLDLFAQSFVLINVAFVSRIIRADLGTLIFWNTTTSIFVSIVIALLLVTSAKNLAYSKWRADLALLRRMIVYGLKFHISILAGAIIIRADLLVVNHFRGSAEAGVYSVASQFALLLMLLPGVIATLLFPRVTSEQDARGETTCQVTRYTTFLMLICCLAAVPFSLLLPVIYGEAFGESTALLWILLPGVYLIGLESVLVQHFNALGLPRAIPLYWVVTLILNLVLVFALVPRYGAQGAAIASSISYAAIFALVALHFHTSTGRSFAEVFVLGSLRG